MEINKLFGREPALAIVTVTKQAWSKPAELKKAFRQGTIFEELNLPFYVGGERYGR